SNHRIRSQKDKILPSGVSPNYIFDFPERFGLVKFGKQAPQDKIDALRRNIPKSREECYRWVPDEFDMMAFGAYEQIGSPEMKLAEGWTIFCRMLSLLQ
ncbi:hypothetical protein R3P38DRAFT_2541811, partial [Favolaschia claudopus]